jgi:hypothetical protein
MGCFINQDIQNCLYILNDIEKFYIADYSSLIEVNYDSDNEIIIDIFSNINWQRIYFDSVSVQTDYNRVEKLYSTAIKMQISELENELELFQSNGKRFVILFIDYNGNCFADGVLPYDNGYIIQNINSEISETNNFLTFELNKTSSVNIKQIDNNYFTFNNL